MTIIDLLFGRSSSQRARNLLAFPARDPKEGVPNKYSGQKVPEKLVKHLHETCVLLGVNTIIGYDLDYMRESWDDFYQNWRIANDRLADKLRKDINETRR